MNGSPTIIRKGGASIGISSEADVVCRGPDPQRHWDS